MLLLTSQTHAVSQTSNNCNGNGQLDDLVFTNTRFISEVMFRYGVGSGTKMKVTIRLSFLSTALIAGISIQAQTGIAYNLAELLQYNQISTSAYSETRLLKDSKPGAISSVHPVLFKDISFSEGI